MPRYTSPENTKGPGGDIISIYDDKRWTAAIIILILADIILLLPPSFTVEVKPSKSILAPNECTTLWVILRNGPALSDVAVKVIGNEEISAEGFGKADFLSPNSEAAFPFTLCVKTSRHGDVSFKVFVSVPGETKIYYGKVRVE